MLLASIEVWSDPVDHRACRVDVYEAACELVLQAYDRRVLTLACASVTTALDTAAAYRRVSITADPQARLSNVRYPVFGRSRSPSGHALRSDRSAR
jgi:hypothetical protein